METRKIVATCFLMVLGALSAPAQTIVGIETESYFYADGEMKKSPGQFEITYQGEGDVVTRVRVYDRKRKEVIPDDTVYRIQRTLDSDPQHLPPLSKAPARRQLFPSVVRAIGQPGSDAVELLVIGQDFIQSCKSTSDYFVISRFKRVK